MKIPIIYSGPKPKRAARKMLVNYLVLFNMNRLGAMVLELKDEGQVTHRVFMAKARGFERGALFVVSVQETARELLARLEDGLELPLRVVRRHRFKFLSYPAE